MKNTPPGPPMKFFGLNQIALFQRERMKQTFVECAETYGDVVRVSLGGLQQTMVFHPDYVRQILLEEPEKITRSKWQQRILGVIHGNSLTNSDGAFWQRQRKLMQPAFHTRRIQQYMETMADKTVNTIRDWQVGSTYDVAVEMVSLTRRIVCDTLFGVDVTAYTERIESAIQTIDDFNMRKAPAMLPLPIWIPLPYHRRTQRAIEDLRNLVMRFIESRRAMGEDRGDLLSMLLFAVDEDDEHGDGQMTNLQARDEVISMLIVGHITTSSALAWAFFEIAQHPEVEAKVLTELDTILAGRAPTMQDVRQLKYLDMVIKEILRLHPPSWALPRDVIEDIEVGEYLIPKGTGVIFSSYVMHHDARWFDEPYRFLPERFTMGWEDKIPKCAYMPFGVGPHNCIGQIFATMEMHVILATVLQQYKMVLEPGQEVVEEALVHLRPRDGVQMRIEKRT